MKSYDVIVVGAGNGGLTAAATTAKAGYKTLLLERHNLPGGCATSFVRGRFEFEVALHELCDIVLGQRRNLRTRAVNVGKDEDVKLPVFIEPERVTALRPRACLLRGIVRNSSAAVCFLFFRRSRSRIPGRRSGITSPSAPGGTDGWAAWAGSCTPCSSSAPASCWRCSRGCPPRTFWR